MRWLARPGTWPAAKGIAAYIEFSLSRSVILLFMVISGEGCLGHLPLALRAQKEGDKEQPEQLVKVWLPQTVSHFLPKVPFPTMTQRSDQRCLPLSNCGCKNCRKSWPLSIMNFLAAGMRLS
jgi:hypothetical protein